MDYYIKRVYNVSRSQKSKVSGEDALFTLFTTMEHGRMWDILGSVFQIKGPTFERIITRFSTLTYEFIYVFFVVQIETLFPMEELRDKHFIFINFKEARYTVDVTFQQSFCPYGSIEEV